MKLRIQGDSLRLRVSPSELARLLDTGRIEETIHFAQDENARLTYALEHTESELEIDVCYAPQEVTVVLSTARARRWAEGDEVGIAGALNLGPHLGQHRLELLVEKDFACLDRNDGVDEDTFPNPKMGAAC